MATVEHRIDRLERAHFPRGIADPDDGDGAAVERRILAGTRVEDLSDQGLVTVLEYWNACAWDHAGGRVVVE